MEYKGSAITDKPDTGSWLGFVTFFGACALMAGAIVVISVLFR